MWLRGKKDRCIGAFTITLDEKKDRRVTGSGKKKAPVGWGGFQTRKENEHGISF